MSFVAANAEESVRLAVTSAKEIGVILIMGSASFFHANFTEHAHFHVIQEVAVIGPAPERVGGHPITAP
jgi:hypothetical protein